MKDLKAKAEQDADYPPILFFYQGTVEEGEHFFQQLWPEARAVSDKEHIFYHAFGLERGGIRQMMGPDVMACTLRAIRKGAIGGKPVGDTRMMPGAFLVQGTEVVWKHTYRHIGDHPDFARDLQ